MTLGSPLATKIMFHIGPVPISEPVVTTWIIMLVLTLASWLATRRPHPTRQALLEIIIGGIDEQIQTVIKHPSGPLLPLVGTLFLFIATANLSAQLPGVSAPTASLETTAALSGIVFFACHGLGLYSLGLKRYLAHYLRPNPIMLPFNILSELTRTLSLAVRLFGNIMSHEFVIAVVLSLAGLLVPVPVMVFGVLIGLLQAYIFAVLATIFIGAAIGAVEGH